MRISTRYLSRKPWTCEEGAPSSYGARVCSRVAECPTLAEEEKRKIFICKLRPETGHFLLVDAGRPRTMEETTAEAVRIESKEAHADGQAGDERQAAEPA